jgi:hypothetical protein
MHGLALGMPLPAAACTGAPVRRSRFADVSPARWPKMREDGSLSVAIRLRCSDGVTVQDVEAVVSAAVNGPEATDPFNELQTLPRVVRDEHGEVEVVLDAVSGSRHWKNWLVILAQAIRNADIGCQPTEFIDLVGGVARPVL